MFWNWDPNPSLCHACVTSQALRGIECSCTINIAPAECRYTANQYLTVKYKHVSAIRPVAVLLGDKVLRIAWNLRKVEAILNATTLYRFIVTFTLTAVSVFCREPSENKTCDDGSIHEWQKLLRYRNTFFSVVPQLLARSFLSTSEPNRLRCVQCIWLALYKYCRVSVPQSPLGTRARLDTMWWRPESPTESHHRSGVT